VARFLGGRSICEAYKTVTDKEVINKKSHHLSMIALLKSLAEEVGFEDLFL
jgi:hypothetical protein